MQQHLCNCLDCNIPANCLMIGLLYSSYHIASTHTVPLMEYLVENRGETLDLSVTSISSPRWMIPHVAASNGHHKLLCLYYQLGMCFDNKQSNSWSFTCGNINATDSRKLTALQICIANNYYHCVNVMLWQNVSIPLKAISNFLKSVPIEKLSPLVDDLLRFTCEIKHSRHLLSKTCLEKLPEDCIHLLAEYILPITSYKDAVALLNMLKNEREKEVKTIEEAFFATEATQTLDIENRIASVGFGGRSDLWTAFAPVNLKPPKPRHDAHDDTGNLFSTAASFFQDQTASQKLLFVSGTLIFLYIWWRRRSQSMSV
ncbi:hypothetical protein RFI_32190 [Reticulomyxa filosa]|uniref:Ankyrin repeat protein n=1 Tax=Reticulomyxa filosa TaxID=46433 RepID=X6LUZ3_RETFI|nr:hypothetical protein RFI_32190 [Reticulomyxa filosa]|eukprot:ETO05206.1 hypothetical protein RFI_32190 [Reticulomyxa filosa]